jgi:hypothetical protein
MVVPAPLAAARRCCTPQHAQLRQDAMVAASLAAGSRRRWQQRQTLTRPPQPPRCPPLSRLKWWQRFRLRA